MSKKIIESAYEMIGGLTPLKTDCGKICGSACCSSKGYMLLFPYEEQLIDHNEFSIEEKRLKRYGDVNVLTCDGVCTRENRPLSCRVFPLSPKIIDKELFIRMDPLSKSVCPLSYNSILSLDSDFTNAVKQTLAFLAKDSQILCFLSAVSDLADDYINILKIGARAEGS